MLPDTVEAVSVVFRDTKNNITYIISKIKVILTEISLCLQYSIYGSHLASDQNIPTASPWVTITVNPLQKVQRGRFMKT